LGGKTNRAKEIGVDLGVNQALQVVMEGMVLQVIWGFSNSRGRLFKGYNNNRMNNKDGAWGCVGRGVGSGRRQSARASGTSCASSFT